MRTPNRKGDWRDRPWWSKRRDAVNYSIVGFILLIMLWEALRRRFGL